MSFRVLIVDPDQHARTTVERALTAAGNLVTCVTGFEEAKQRLLFAPPDLLVIGRPARTPPGGFVRSTKGRLLSLGSMPFARIPDPGEQPDPAAIPRHSHN